jgi:hypothetical protein
MIGYLRNMAKKNMAIRKFVGYTLASSGLFDAFFRQYKVGPVWEKRIAHVLSSADNAFIPKVADAGQIKSGKQIMHNGLKIHLGSYYGPEYAKMLLLSKGVHEPQEERVFMEVLKGLPDGAVMLEMGAFWSFYSMWFQHEVKNAVNYLVEPDAFNLGQGQRNFALNGMKGTFMQAFVGKETKAGDPVGTLSVDGIVAKHNIPFIHVLHSDIQGFEGDMLIGAAKSFAEKKIGYVFVSTHSNAIHDQCRRFLLDQQFVILADANIDESFSEDGLIVARAPNFSGIGPVPISKRKAQEATIS